MSTTEQLGVLLHTYMLKQESAFADLKEFCDYVRRYAARNLEEQPDLLPLVEITEAALLAELEELAARREVYIQGTVVGKTSFIGISYYSASFAKRYKDILLNPAIPFPGLGDLPKQLPPDVLEKQDASMVIPLFNRRQDIESQQLYILRLPRDVPAILFPECVPVQLLIRAAMIKIRRMLKKDEFHDYFQKKLRVANPSKEMMSQNFFSKFVHFPDTEDFPFSLEGDSFYFWTQLCYFIRLDFEKVKDRVSEDTNILQAITISEIWMATIKEAALKAQAKAKALAELEAALAQPPYFFSMDAILKFTDSKGALLYGQFGEEDLQATLEKFTTESDGQNLPKLLVLKIESGTRYFIYKVKVFPLVVRLANEAHTTVEKRLVDRWCAAMRSFQKLPEMTDARAFEESLKKEVRAVSPVLYALLSSSFLMPLHYELGSAQELRNFHLFSGGKLLPYSELLMLRPHSVMSAVRLRLPFWHSIPLLVWIAALLFGKGGAKQAKKYEPAAEKEVPAEMLRPPERHRTKRDALSASARQIGAELVPAGSTIDRELDSYLSQWNKLITKEANRQLTEDVNALIRDYMRKVIRTISAKTFTLDRVQSLAHTLIRTPNMQRIKESDALYMYVQLYILRLMSNT